MLYVLGNSKSYNISNAPMNILREAMTRYSHTGKPVQGNQGEMGRGKTQLQYNKSNPHKIIQRYSFYRRTVSVASYPFL